MRPEINWWLGAARRDGEMARSLARENLFEGAAFHLQQAAEKALKALLLKRGKESRTNSCVQMEHILRASGMETGEIANECKNWMGTISSPAIPMESAGHPRTSTTGKSTRS